MKKHQSKQAAKQTRQRPHFSPAIKEAAKWRLREFEMQSEEGFLTRAEMDRRLYSL